MLHQIHSICSTILAIEVSRLFEFVSQQKKLALPSPTCSDGGLSKLEAKSRSNGKVRNG